MNSNIVSCEINYIDFGKSFNRWQHILSHFELNKHCKLAADFDPVDSKVTLFSIADENGELKEEMCGRIDRKDIERFITHTGWKFLEPFETGRKLRIIVDYNPQNEKASIEYQFKDMIRSAGRSGISELMDSCSSQYTL